MLKRGAGVLLHITSLPSPGCCGDLGPAAYQFADFLSAAKQSFWQVLPLNPTETTFGNSPYSSISSYAGNPLLISPELLLRDGLLSKEELKSLNCTQFKKIDYPAALNCKEKLFRLAFEKFKLAKDKCDYEKFLAENSYWLEDFAVFKALKNYSGGLVWSDWPAELRDRVPAAITSVKKILSEDIEKEKFLQYLFFEQWFELKDYCHQKGIQFFGDIPIYVSYDSVNVWKNPEIFKLTADKKPEYIAGVPPDYFSKTGQLWKNPVYRWDELKKTSFAWWVKRIEHNLKLFDLIRIDHFRGLVAYWEVPAVEKNAICGRWVQAPVEDFLNTLCRYFYSLPIIAEDLGVITEDVKEIMRRFEFPGMKVLLFAFGEDNPLHPYLPHNYASNCVVYTGTHDNNTVRGWFENEATPEDKNRLFRYLGKKVSAEEVNCELIRLAMMSIASLVIIPLQDILGLGADARMNRPGTPEGNWEWRILPDQLSTQIKENLLKITEMYERV